MKKKLLFVVDEREMGGVSVVLTDLIHFLDENKYEIDVLVLHDNGTMLNDLGNHVDLIFGTSYFEAIDYTIKEVFKSKNINLIMKKIKVVFDLKTGLIKKRIIKERKKCVKKKYDVEIAFKDGFTALFTAYGDTKRKIHWLHCAYQTNNPNEKYESLFKEALPKFDRIVGVADNVVKEFNALYHLEDITEVIPVIMDIKKIKTKAKENAEIKLDHTKVNIAVIGRAHPVKGYDRMVDVFNKLNKEKLLKNVSVHVFGDGPLFNKICVKIKELCLQDIILMEGQVDNPYKELKNYSFLLLPSYSEAFGTVISEAMILGVPVLATRTSASEMSIKDGVYGWICDNSEEGIYETLKLVIKNTNKIKECQKNLIDFHYDNHILMDKIELVL